MNVINTLKKVLNKNRNWKKIKVNLKNTYFILKDIITIRNVFL